jgi:hypothetical protein
MSKIYLRGVAGMRRSVLASAVAVVALLAVAASASALPFHPTGIYANFGDCPLGNTSVVSCIYSTTNSGEVKIGSTAVPITNQIVLQGGLTQNAETGATTFINAADGTTLTKAAQTVPGGLLGIIAPEFLPEFLQVIFNEFINHGPTGVTATTELVGTPTWNQENLEERTGTGVSLPVRLHLENGFLGSACYIGSSSSPVTLALTTGTTAPPAPNTPITGTLGTITFKEGGKLLIATGDKLVNNSFSVPTASGCGGIFSLLVDPVIDLKLGLPSAAGKNTAILKGNLEQASAAAVKASE